MEEKYFVELNKLYADFEKNYKTRADEQRKVTCSQIKTKGRMYDVFPYQEERLGDKTKGKVVKEIEMKDGNFIFYFDENNRIRLVEEACTFLKTLYSYECYEYVGNKIYKYCGVLSGVNRISIGIYENNKLMETYSMYSWERRAYEKYIYNGDLLCYIETYVFEERKANRQRKEQFYFNEKGDLQLIQRIRGAWKENTYSVVKINNKKLESAIDHQVTAMWKDLQCQINSLESPVIGINLNLENDISDIDFFFESKGEMQILDKKYNIRIRDLPLDNDEKEKIINIVLKTMLRLWDEKCLDEQVCLRIKMDGVNILNKENILPRWMKKNLQLVVCEDVIRYRHLDEKQKSKEKRIKEIFMDLKKSVNKDKTLSDLVTCFEQMGKVIAKDANYESLDDMFLMEAETVSYKDRLMFGFSLIRQIPYKEEFLQLGMEVIYELNDRNRLISHSCWDEDVDGDFFTYVRSTDAYNIGCKDSVYDVHLFLNET